MNDGFHQELQAILMAPSPGEACERLLAACAGRSVAGVCGFSFAIEKHSIWAMQIAWGQDLSGELDGIDVREHAENVVGSAPLWLQRWVLRRNRPFHLHQYSRFIPFSTAALLRDSAPQGRRRLQDFIIVPFRHHGQGVGALLGLHAPASKARYEELVTLTSACLARQPWPELVHEDVPRLSERQIECLTWIVAGKSMAETAQLTGMSYSTVRYHLEQAKQRAGLSSLQQLIAFAAVEYDLSPLGPQARPRRSTASLGD
jgi:DNA-binding CsgD family transcriptional regulator